MIRAALIMVVVLSAGAAPREVQVRDGESLEQLAERELGDAGAAKELRALNGLGEGPVAPGTKVKVPGEERERAMRALEAARNAILQRDGGQSGNGARAQLASAEDHFANGRYSDAAHAADAAWKLVSDSKQTGTAFSVEVKESGETRVVSQRGQPVRVEAQGVQQKVEPGLTVRVIRGKQPEPTKVVPTTPALSSPKDNALFKLKPDKRGQLGPVKLAWQKARGATSYEIELLPEKEGSEPVILTSTKNQVAAPKLPPGKYWWKVKALGADGMVSEASPARAFSVEADELKLEIRGAGWK